VFLYDFCQERMFHILTSCDYRTSLRDSWSSRLENSIESSRNCPTRTSPVCTLFEQEDAGFLSSPTHRTLRISFRSSRSSYWNPQKS
jgi:hypothetical protein